MINLTIDRGNTTTKLVTWKDGEPLVSTTLFNADSATLVRSVADMTFDRAAICTVAGSCEGLEEYLAGRGVRLLTLTNSTPLPIGIRYATPSTLGVDRIAAAIGASTLFPGKDVLVADIGTCVTYDRIDGQGNFLGGNIAPGIGMRIRAMHTFTKALPAISSAGETPVLGISTDTAMRAGAFYGVVAELSYYHSLLPDGGITALTGGWSEKIMKALNFDARLCPLLVNRGLNRILNNETF